MAFDKILRTVGEMHYFCDLATKEWARDRKPEISNEVAHLRRNGGAYDYSCIGSYNPDVNEICRPRWSNLWNLFEDRKKRNRRIYLALADGIRDGNVHGFEATFKKGHLLVRMGKKSLCELLEVDQGRILLKGDTRNWEMHDGGKIFYDERRPEETVWKFVVGDAEFKVGPVIDQVYRGIVTRYKLK